MKRQDIHSVLIIGSGPIVIGQACEFDYSGTQACKALSELGYKTILVNSNPSTIMTDPTVADVTYIEPLDIEHIIKIINLENPDAILPNMGGQIALNLCIELDRQQILKKYNIEVLGVNTQAIEIGENRLKFKEIMEEIGIHTPISFAAHSVEEALDNAERIGYPVIIRPSFTLGGGGAGIAHNQAQLTDICKRGLRLSIINQVLVEESVEGWAELELEVIRDKNFNTITVASIENIDPMGVHTGDSACVVPMVTIPISIQDKLRQMAYQIVNQLEIIGGVNVQFAYQYSTGRIVVIEINPRTSRSSALASKASGFPIAYISALLACGISLDEIPYNVDDTLNHYKSNSDYYVVKLPRWSFDKFVEIEDHLGSQMLSIGEVMSIGKTFKEAWQKAVRSLEDGRCGPGQDSYIQKLSIDELIDDLQFPTSKRQFFIYEALKKGVTLTLIHQLTHIHKWFLKQWKELADFEKQLSDTKCKSLSADVLFLAKQNGFSDKYISLLTNSTEASVRSLRLKYQIKETWDVIPTINNRNAAYYSTYCKITHNDNNFIPLDTKKKIIILGSGPNRIGQGIEFDYCCVHASKALKKLGYETIMINCNPETVSTDYDVSDKLYFEAITLENILSIYSKEQAFGIVTQFGGQTPLNLSDDLEKNGLRILGTSASNINIAEDRAQFYNLMRENNILMPESYVATDADSALFIAEKIGYPVLMRPSFVLGGKSMRVIHNEHEMHLYINSFNLKQSAFPLQIDSFLENGLECEVDAVSDGKNVYFPSVLEQIERAGVHSGDSVGVLPSISINSEYLSKIKEYVQKIGKELNIIGIFNIQFVIYNNQIYVIEVNPRASRTVPLFSKVSNVNLIELALKSIAKEQTGLSFDLLAIKNKTFSIFGVKEPVFSYKMLNGANPKRSTEMRSTGESLGLDKNFYYAYFKAKLASSARYSLSGGTLLLSDNCMTKELLTFASKVHDYNQPIFADNVSHSILEKSKISSYLIKDNDNKTVIRLLNEGAIRRIVLFTSSKYDYSNALDIIKFAYNTGIPVIDNYEEAGLYIKLLTEKVKIEDSGVCSLQTQYHNQS